MGTKLFVGNLNSTTREDSLRSVLSANGRVVKSITIPSDRGTGRPRGFAFVEMGSESEARAAIEEVNGKDLDGCALKVKAHGRADAEIERGRAMSAGDWMKRGVFSCRPETDLNEAARLMWEQDCGCLPVLDAEGRVVAMVTDRDLCMAAYTRGKPLLALFVKDSMAKELFICRPSDTLEHVIGLMARHQIRRIPVVDEDGKLQGLISLNDLTRNTMRIQDSRRRASLSLRLIEALAATCEPRGGEPERPRFPPGCAESAATPGGTLTV